MTHFRRRMKRLLAVLGGWLILGLIVIDDLIHPEHDPWTR